MRYALVFVLTIPLSLRAAHGAQAWAVDSNSPGGHGDAVVKFDTSNPAGTIQVVGHTEVTGFFMSGLDFDGLGNLFAVSQVSGAGTASGSLYKIDQADGHATLVGNLGLPSARSMIDFTFNPADQKFYGVAFDNSKNFLYTISPDTGAATLVGQINHPAGSIFLGLAADASGKMYVEDFNGARMRKLTGLNVSAMSDVIGPPVQFSQGMCIDWSHDGAWYLAATWQNQPFTFNASGDVRLIDPLTGGTSQVLGAWPQLSNNSYPIYAIGDIAVNPVPEPQALACVLIGLLIRVRSPRRARVRPTADEAVRPPSRKIPPSATEAYSAS